MFSQKLTPYFSYEKSPQHHARATEANDVLSTSCDMTRWRATLKLLLKYHKNTKYLPELIYRETGYLKLTAPEGQEVEPIIEALNMARIGEQNVLG